MSSAMLLGVLDWIGDFFKALIDMIPKVIYLLYASLACVLDVLQLFFRKLAGLDVYYIDGESVSGDLVTNFIAGILGIKLDNNANTYPALTTVFYAFVVFGVIVCFACTLIAVIKSHYNYDDKAAKGPMQYVYTAGKAIINMVAVPIIVVLGLYVSQALLTALDTITSTTSSDIISLYGSQTSLLQSVDTVKSATGKSSDSTYIYYDIFGFGGKIVYSASSTELDLVTETSELVLIGSTTQTFSGSLFKVAAYNANRVRSGTSMSYLSGFGENQLFYNAYLTNDADLGADMIDTAFANNLHLNYTMRLEYDESDSGGVWTSFNYFTNYLTRYASNFTKFNVGLVWYYYDLWSFNFIVGFGAIFVCLTIFINIILGLITRIFMCVALFFIAPPLFGLAPLDGGEAKKNWIKTFMQQVLMVYGAVLGMNIMFLLLPYINEIDFFNITIADYFAQTLIIIVGLISIKALIGTISSVIGGANADKIGADISKEVGGTLGKAATTTIAAGKIGALPLKGAIGTGKLFGSAMLTAKSEDSEKKFRNLSKEEGNALDKMNKNDPTSFNERSQLQTDALNAIKNGDKNAAQEMLSKEYGSKVGKEMTKFLDKNKNEDWMNDAGERDKQIKSFISTSKNKHEEKAAKHAENYTRRFANFEKRARSIPENVTGSIKNTATGTLGIAKDVFTSNQGIKELTESIWKPPKYDKITAERLGDLNDYIAGTSDTKYKWGRRAGQVKTPGTPGLFGRMDDLNGNVNNMVHAKEEAEKRAAAAEKKIRDAEEKARKEQEAAEQKWKNKYFNDGEP